MSATLLSYCNPSLACNYGRVDSKRMAFGHLRSIGRRNNGYRKLTVFSVTEGSAKSSESEETIPSWAKPDSEEPPPWAREEGKEIGTNQGFQVPFYVYLLASSITAIAAIGSVFEYVNQKPVFGIINSDSILYAPLLGFFAFTGIPTAKIEYKNFKIKPGVLFSELYQFVARNVAHKVPYTVSTAKGVIRRMTIPLQKHELPLTRLSA